ncbi:MAG: PAS domain S-box protein [Cyclobacteriaceae bacterium]|nr:PAS domain S-box protein [Cyclobacteriaceae bacterium]
MVEVNVIGKTRYSVLLIEDNKVDQLAFKRMVKTEGNLYDYQIAGSVAEGHKILQDHDFDVVITDYYLGDGTAFDIISDIKDTPIIFMTGSGDEKLAVDAMKSDVFDYLVKDNNYHYLSVLPSVISKAINFHVTQKKLDQANRRYKLLVENANDIIYETDGQGFITFVNEVGRKITKYEINEIQGKHYSEFVRPDYKEKVNQFYQNQLDNHISGTYMEYPIISKSGDEIWIGQNVAILFDSEKKTKGLQGVVRDITEKRKNEQKIREQNVLLEKQNKEIKNAIDNLLKARIGRKATTIVLGIAIILFLISEAIFEPIVEKSFDSAYVGLFFKGIIAIALKPIDIFVEKYLVNKRYKTGT